MTIDRYITIEIDENRLKKIGAECIREYLEDMQINNYGWEVTFDEIFEEYKDYFYEECVDIDTDIDEDSDFIDNLFDEADENMKDILFDIFDTIQHEE